MSKRKKKRKGERPAAPAQPTPNRASLFPWQPLVKGAVALGVVIVCTLMLGAPRKTVIERQSNPRFVQNIINTIVSQRPQAVFLGNSMLIEGVDDALFTELSGVKTMNIAFHGAASAVYFLTLKNVLLPARNKPEVVFVFFRNQYLTNPGRRVTGIEKRMRLDPLTDPEGEPVLDRLAYFNELNSAELLLQRNWRLYQDREKIKRSTETSIKNGVASLLGKENVGAASLAGADQPEVARTAADQAIARTFADENMIQELLSANQLSSEQVKQVSEWDFAARLPDSFLPQMIELAEEGSFQLVFVRLKTRNDALTSADPEPARERYVDDLRAYLEGYDIPLLDFTGDERIKLEHFGAGDHLSREVGMPIFTRLLSEELKPYLPPTGVRQTNDRWPE